MDDAVTTQKVQGKDGRWWFLCIPLGGAPSLEEATDDCMDEGRGDYVERARFSRNWWTLGVVSYQGYSVVGDVGNSKAVRNERK